MNSTTPSKKPQVREALRPSNIREDSRKTIVLNGASVPVAQVGPRVLYISAFRVPPYVGDATLAAALSTYGKVLAIQESQFKGRPTVGTGVRVIRMEMAKPVPNFLSVQGHRIMFDYQGIRKVCSRCGAEGHLGKTCETPRCERCEVYGHETAKCTSPSYAAAAAGANIPASIEDNDGQPDQYEVQTSLEGPRHSELSETASRSESSDSSEDEDFPPLPSTERSTTEVNASETDSSKTTSPSEHETDAADSATRESVAVNEPTDKPRPSVDRRHHPQPEQTPSPAIGRETGLAQARGYHVPRTTDASLMNPVSQVTDLLLKAEAMDTDKPDIKRTREAETDSTGSQKNGRSKIPKKLRASGSAVGGTL
ncbi:hypothetical protein HPB49_000387 [Dermacentor silvarum]|uniref:Uncharacterized protein n=1 Tax=Dermacentor silvarum TaxID=543639 RepID=A0ACB8C0D6_DERSI|nr:hypothetical protein HPB49_000387 [Dermacentor silvarum]